MDIYHYIQFLLMFVFLFSGVLKLIGIPDFVATIEQLQIRRKLARLTAFVVILLELLAAVLLMFRNTQFIANCLILLLCGCFAWAVCRAMLMRLKVACNCFGNMMSEKLGWGTAVRILLILILTVTSMISTAQVDWHQYSWANLFEAAACSASILLGYALLPYALLGRVENK